MQESHVPQFENQEPVTRPKEEFVPPDFLDMYQISGQDQISQHSFERYMDSKEKYDAKIRELAETKKPVDNTVDAELEPDIGIDLEDPDLDLKNTRIADAIISKYCQYPGSEEEKKNTERHVDIIIRQGLESNDPIIFKNCAYIHWNTMHENPAYDQKISDFITQGLKSQDAVSQNIAADCIRYLPNHLRPVFIGKGLKSDSIEVQKTAASHILWLNALVKDQVPGEEVERLRQNVQDIVQTGLVSTNQEKKKNYVAMIPSIPEDNIEAYTLWALERGDSDTQMACITLAYRYPTQIDEIKFVKTAIDLGSPAVQYAAMEMYYQSSSANEYTFGSKVAEIIEGNLSNKNPVEQKIYRNMIKFVPDNQRDELFDKVAENYGNIVVESPLYDKNEINGENFSRANFDKTGSETTLVGGPLKEKVIIRRFTPENFIAWQKLYENAELWQEKGFDYIPIEPIVSYTPGSDGLVNVYASVLDLTYSKWSIMTSKFHSELQTDLRIILATLKEKDYRHGHPHENNFCLRFFRDSEGKVIFDKKPRIYLIDFDRAASPPK